MVQAWTLRDINRQEKDKTMNRINGTVTFIYIPVWPQISTPRSASITGDNGKQYKASMESFVEPPELNQRVSFKPIRDCDCLKPIKDCDCDFFDASEMLATSIYKLN